MDAPLTEPEVRVLGCLIEKQLATPEYYPMTLNSLTAACNQKTSRDPVVEYSDDDVRDTLDALREKNLTAKIFGPGVRAPKHRHNLDQAWQLSRPALAVLAVLMLRGAQTAAEIRSRTERMHDFGDIAEVEAVLHALMNRANGALVVKLARQGRREEYAHLLCGMPPAADANSSSSNSAAPQGKTTSARMAELESLVQSLQEQLQALQEEFAAFRKHFE